MKTFRIIVVMMAISLSNVYSEENVVLEYPLGGETAYLDSNITIKWKSGNDNDYVDIEYFNIKQNEWVSIEESVESIEGDNEYNWSTPNLENTLYAIVRISSENITSSSKKYFKLNIKPLPKKVNIEEQLKVSESLNVYPTPTTDILNIEVGNDNFDRIRVINSNGSIVNEIKFTNQLNVSNLTTGIYLLSLEANDKVKTIKFIITR